MSFNLYAYYTAWLILWLLIDSVFVLSDMIGASHMWPLNPWNIASGTWNLKFKFKFILNSLNCHTLLVDTPLDSIALFNLHQVSSSFINVRYDFYCYDMLWVSSYTLSSHCHFIQPLVTFKNKFLSVSFVTLKITHQTFTSFLQQI